MFQLIAERFPYSRNRVSGDIVELLLLAFEFSGYARIIHLPTNIEVWSNC
jgi:hypothetical protein